MNRILWYELKRLIWNKVFAGLLAVSLLYGCILLTGTIIRGVAYTAPFSPWSYGFYLSQMMSVLLIALLFFVAALSSPNEKRVRVITRATDVKQSQYWLIKIASQIIGFILLCIVICFTAVVFYISLFHLKNFKDFAIPMLLTLIPPAVFTLGLGMMLGSFHTGLIYILMVVLTIYNSLPLPYEFSITGGHFFSQYPLELKVLDPPLSIPAGFLISRLVFFIAGLVLGALCLSHKERNRKG